MPFMIGSPIRIGEILNKPVESLLTFWCFPSNFTHFAIFFDIHKDGQPYLIFTTIAPCQKLSLRNSRESNLEDDCWFCFLGHCILEKKLPR